MREILFRAKQRATLKWVYGYAYQHTHYSATKEIVGEYWHIIQPDKDVTIEEGTLGQFTGLTDKNDNQIFEGDIVKLTENNYKYEWTAVVEFGNPNSYYSWGWQLKPITKNVEYNLDILCWIDMDDVGVTCEVIGNIYDNSELLGGAK